MSWWFSLRTGVRFPASPLISFTKSDFQVSYFSNYPMSDKLKVSRRGFMNSIIVSWTALTAMPFIYGIIKFIFPPVQSANSLESVIAARVQDIPINTAKIVKFNKRPVIVIHTPLGQFKAFSANCTHLGCIVEYKGEERQLHCNCHGSVFDLNGNNIRGPANSPLAPLKVSLNQSDIVISSPTI